ncbi:MAG: patatin-like protein [Pseudomonadales bacterium]
MAKKELRLALVIYGGASLAVYMHGVTKELLKLVRASKVLHEMGPDAATMAYADGPDQRPHDTEAIYFEVLKAANAGNQFRVVIDVIAGASAGAINGVMMAKALVDDALLDAQTTAWMADADIERLAAQDASRWRKWYLYPLLRALSLWLPKEIGRNVETRGKITRLVRSSWFRPPFSGERLSHHFFDALEAMAASRREGSTLLPPGQRLDVYASITDLFGYPRTIRLNQGLVAREKEHAAYCQLSHRAGEEGPVHSDLGDDNLPALVWAARASSSYAGAFPPFHHDEMKRVLAARQRIWPGEDGFLKHGVRARDGTPAWKHFDPANRHFVDGGIVNNKPFGAALEALNNRAADRQVDRCLVYVEPDPNLQDLAHPERSMGYLATIRAALSSIPRNQPILDDLNSIVAQDARVQINRRIIDANRPEIERMVKRLQEIHARQTMTPELIGYLRLLLALQAESAMGLAYHVYVQRRVWRLVDALVRSWADLADHGAQPDMIAAMEQSVAQWWQMAADSQADDAADGASAGEVDSARRDARQEGFLDQFDVSFRIRRLQFLVRRINQHEDDKSLDERSVALIDEFKRQVYGFMERCYALRRSEHIDPDLVAHLGAAFERLPLPPEESRELLRRAAGALNLERFDREVDAAFCVFHDKLGEGSLRSTLLGDYVGFPVYDVLLLAPGTLEGGPDPLTPIRVERISPADARELQGQFRRLLCRDFMGFVGFFNRGYREHDYLWGRLNGAERVVDLLVTAIGGVIDDPAALKRRLFRAIVERERGRLERCDDELDRLQEAFR